MYPQDLIDSLLAQADIADVISSYIPVEKKGRSYTAVCPFHDDHDPSLSISKEKRIFKCFVCGAGGNAISFAMKFEKIPYAQAVRKVADIANFHDPRLIEDAPKIKISPEKQRLYDCINDLAKYYAYALTIPEGEEARNYLEKRNLTAQVEKYQVGYAPKDGATTVQYLLAKGHSLKSIVDIGIGLDSGGVTKDRNAGRIIFPLHDPRGQIIGFSARRIVDDGTSKYINTMETPLFHKGNVLYNYHNAATSARHDGYCYVLEGFMDVMALERAGITNAVALMGTALTSDQIELLKRLKCEIRFCLDGDAAGQNAMMKATLGLKKAGVSSRLVDYGGDLRDPDEILQEEGAEAVKKRMDTLVDPVDFQLNYYLNKKLETAEERKKVLTFFLPHLKAQPQGIEFEDVLAKLAKATRFDKEAIRKMAMEGETAKAQTLENPGLVGARAKPKSYGEAMKDHNRAKLYRAESACMFYMLSDYQAIVFFQKYIKSFQEPSLKQIYNYLLDYVDTKTEEKNVDASSLIGYIQSQEEDQETSENLVDYLTSLENDKTIEPFNAKMLDRCLETILEERENVKNRLQTQQALESATTDQEKGEAIKKLASIRRQSFKKNKE